MRRRDFLGAGSAAGALAACGLPLALDAGTARAATSPIPPRSLRQLGGRQVWLPIGARGRGVNGSAAYFDATNTAVMDQTAWWAPAYGPVSAVRLVYARFDMPQQGEVDRSVTATLTASVVPPASNALTATTVGTVAAGATTVTLAATVAGVNGISAGQSVTSPSGGLPSGEYVSGVSQSIAAGSGASPVSTIVTLASATTGALYNTQPLMFAGAAVPVTFAGSRQGVLAPAHDVLVSDPVPVQLAAGAGFFVRSWGTLSAAGLQIMDYPGVASGPSTRLAGEWSNRGTAEADLTLAPVTLGNTGGGFWCPVAMLGLVTLAPGQAQPGAVLILGDSIAAGTGDTSDGTLGIMGYVQRSLGNAVPWISLARGSTLAFGEAAQGRGQYAFSLDDGITDVFLELCRNDIESLQLSASVTETAVAQAAAPYLATGRRVWPFTCVPSTYSNDGWATLANQGFPAAAQTLTAAVAAGATTVTLAATGSVAAGQLVTQGTTTGTLSVGTTVSAVSGTVVTLGAATLGTIAAGAKLYFGTQNPAASAVEVQRQAYNAFMRGSYASLGLQPPVDIDAVVADPSGKWRVFASVSNGTTTTLAGTADGVHPSPVAHAAAVAAGIVPVSSILP